MRNPLYDWWHARQIPHFCPTCYHFQAVAYTLPYDPEVPHRRFCQLAHIKVEANRCQSWKYEPVENYRKNYGIYNSVKGGRPVPGKGIHPTVGTEPPHCAGTK